MPRSHISAWSRRAVLRGVAGAAAGAWLAPFATPARGAGAIVSAKIAPDLTLLRGAGGNVLVLVTADGQVLVDSGAAASVRDLVATLGALPGGRVSAVLNTHWHLDQVGGNEAFGNAGATIIAHEKTRLKLATGYYVPTEDRYEKPLPKAALPTQTFYTTESFTLGGRKLDCGYLIEAHTDGDMYVRFASENVIAAGDAIAPERDPALDWFGGGWLGGRVDALAKLLELGDARTKYVPSVGPVVGRAEVQAEHDAMLAFFERMVERIRLGEDAQTILAAGVLDGLGRTFADPYKLVYDAHKGLWAHHNKLMPDIV